MYSGSLLSDAAILHQAAGWLDNQPEKYVLLITVVETFGSSPAPAGSIMVCNVDNEFAGSVSGGCIEQDLLPKLQALDFRNTAHYYFDYGIDAGQAHSTGLTCGGNLRLLVERLEVSAQITPLLTAIQQRIPVQRRLCLNTGEVSLHSSDGTGLALFATGDSISRLYGPRWRLLLIGANHLAYCLAEIAHGLDFEVIITDPRPVLTPPPNALPVTLLQSDPEDAVRLHVTDARCAVIALSHNSNLDDAALADALQSPAFYVGALGSKNSARKRAQRLLALGVEQPKIDLMHAPVGLAIGSHRPNEIAIAIAAELIAQRNRVHQTK